MQRSVITKFDTVWIWSCGWPFGGSASYIILCPFKMKVTETENEIIEFKQSFELELVEPFCARALFFILIFFTRAHTKILKSNLWFERDMVVWWSCFQEHVCCSFPWRDFFRFRGGIGLTLWKGSLVIPRIGIFSLSLFYFVILSFGKLSHCKTICYSVFGFPLFLGKSPVDVGIAQAEPRYIWCHLIDWLLALIVRFVRVTYLKRSVKIDTLPHLICIILINLDLRPCSGFNSFDNKFL